jgi:cytochrome c-type biogenesis protein
MTVDLSTVGIATAFAAGAMSFLSPCVLPLVPAYVSYIAGESVEGRAEKRARSLWLSLFFVFGFTTVFVILGAGANVLNAALAPYRHQLTLVSGALVILFGIFTLGLWRPAWSERELRVHARLPRSGPLPAYLLGMAFAFGWTPCIGPVLGAILALAASSSGGRYAACHLLARSGLTLRSRSGVSHRFHEARGCLAESWTRSPPAGRRHHDCHGRCDDDRGPRDPSDLVSGDISGIGFAGLSWDVLRDRWTGRNQMTILRLRARFIRPADHVRFLNLHLCDHAGSRPKQAGFVRSRSRARR